MEIGWPDANYYLNKLKKFPTDLPKEWRLPPLKYNAGSGVEEPSPTSPSNTTQPPMETALGLNEILWPQVKIWGK